MAIRYSRPSKITDVGANRKPMCDFLLVINSNILSCIVFIFRLLQIIGQIYALTGLQDFFNTLVHDKPLTHDHRIWPRDTMNIALSCGANCFDVFNHLALDHECERWMDSQNRH